MAHSTVSSNPEVSAVIFKQGTCTEITKPVALLVIRKALGTPAAHAFVGRNPDASILTLCNSANEVVDQTVLGHVANKFRTVLSKDTSAFCSNPENAVPVAEDVTNADAADSRKAHQSCLTVMKAKQICRGDPKIAIVILIHGFGVIVAGVGQGNRLNRSSAQPQHSCLGADPDVFLHILKQ